MRTPRHRRSRLRAPTRGSATPPPHVRSAPARERTAATRSSCGVAFAEVLNSPPSKAVEKLTAESLAHPQNVSEVGQEGFGSSTVMGGVVAVRSSTLVRAIRARLGSPPPNSKKAGTTAGLSLSGCGRVLSGSGVVLPMRTPVRGAQKDHPNTVRLRHTGLFRGLKLPSIKGGWKVDCGIARTSTER